MTTLDGEPRQAGRRDRLVAAMCRDGSHCFWCGRELTGLVRPTTDHVVPRVKGGPSWLENEVAACRRCNAERGHLGPVEWLEECRRPSRRTVLTGAAAAFLTGCGGPDDDRPARPVAPGTTPPVNPTAAPATTPPDRTPEVAALFADLERRFDSRLGLYARDTGSGAFLTNRADERFAMCSTFKALAAAVLHENDPAQLERELRISRADFLEPSPITAQHLGGTMTLEALCEAAVQASDNTAGNLLLREIGGPAGFTAFVRSLGDDVTRLDRIEPDLNAAVPGDPRDTTTPRAFATTLEALVLGNALDAADRRLFTAWLEGTTTGDNRIRAGAPRGWRVGDKTGTGSYATTNDTAILWPPKGAPIALAVLTSRTTESAERDEKLLADATRIALTTLTRA